MPQQESHHRDGAEEQRRHDETMPEAKHLGFRVVDRVDHGLNEPAPVRAGSEADVLHSFHLALRAPRS